MQVQEEGVANIVFPQEEKKRWRCPVTNININYLSILSTAAKVTSERSVDCVSGEVRARCNVNFTLWSTAGHPHLHIRQRCRTLIPVLLQQNRFGSSASFFFFFLIFTLQSLCVKNARLPVTVCLPTVSCFSVISSLCGGEAYPVCAAAEIC